MTDQTNTPELRFPEFKKEWQCNTLDNCCYKISDGIHSTPIYSKSGDFSFINGNNLINGKIHFENAKLVDSKEALKHKRNLTYNETILLSINGTIGNIALYRGEKIILGKSAAYINIKANFLNPLFLYYFLETNSLQRYFRSELTGTTIKNLSIKSIKKTKLYIPNITEQRKIGDFFSKLDQQIELEEKKLELLEQQKKGYMQKIFSQESIFKDENGNSYPKWKSKKIKELFNVIDGDRGKNYPSEKDFYDKGHTLFLDTGNVTKNGFLFNRNRFIDKEKDDMLRKGKLELNDFVITSRGTLGNIGFYGQNIHHKYPNIRINSAMLILRPLNNKFNNQYLYFLLKNDVIDTFMKHYRVGSAQPHITKKDFGNMKISVIIDINEQRKIAKFLTIIDKLVINQSNKVELLKQRKQGLLQKMFI